MDNQFAFFGPPTPHPSPALHDMHYMLDMNMALDADVSMWGARLLVDLGMEPMAKRLCDDVSGFVDTTPPGYYGMLSPPPPRTFPTMDEDDDVVVVPAPAAANAAVARPVKKFKFDGVLFAGTYSALVVDGVSMQPIGTRQALFDALNLLGDGIKECIIAQEAHANGAPHYHCYVKFNKRVQTVNVKFFDVCGVHPNIGTDPSRVEWWEYITKDDIAPLVFGIVDLQATLTAMKQKKRKNKPAKVSPADVSREMLVLAEAGKVNDAMQMYKEAMPAEYLLQGPRVRQNLMLEVPVVGETMDGMLPIKPMFATIDILSFFEGRRQKCVVLVGPANLGKSVLATHLIQNAFTKLGKIHEHILRVNSVDGLKRMAGFDAFIYDEACFQRASAAKEAHSLAVDHQKLLLTLDSNVDIPARYAPAHIPKNFIRVFTCNNLADAFLISDPAISSRLHVIEVNEQVWIDEVVPVSPQIDLI